MGGSTVTGFDEYVAARGPALLRLAVMLTGDPHRAEDLVQDALAQAFRHWPTVTAADSPHAYVRRILVRQHLSWWRRASSRERPMAEPASASASVESDVGESYASRDAAWSLLARLPRQQRTVLALRYYEDLSDAQIAEALGCSSATVRAHASRGLGALREVVPTLDEELLP